MTALIPLLTAPESAAIGRGKRAGQASKRLSLGVVDPPAVTIADQVNRVGGAGSRDSGQRRVAEFQTPSEGQVHQLGIGRHVPRTGARQATRTANQDRTICLVGIGWNTKANRATVGAGRVVYPQRGIKERPALLAVQAVMGRGADIDHDPDIATLHLRFLARRNPAWSCLTGVLRHWRGVTGVAYHGPAAAGFVRIGGSVASDGGTLCGTTGSSRKAIPAGKCTGIVGNPTASWASPKPQPRASTDN